MAEHIRKVTKGEWYKLTATADAEVKATLEDETVLLASQVGCEQNAQAFQAPTDTLKIITDGKFVLLPTRAADNGSGVNKSAVNALVGDFIRATGLTWNSTGRFWGKGNFLPEQQNWEYPMSDCAILTCTFGYSSIIAFHPEGGCPVMTEANSAFTHSELTLFVSDCPKLRSAMKMFYYARYLRYFRTNDLSNLVMADSMFEGADLDCWSIKSVLDALPRVTYEEVDGCENEIPLKQMGKISFYLCSGCEYMHARGIVESLKAAVAKGWTVEYGTAESGKMTAAAASSIPVEDMELPEPNEVETWDAVLNAIEEENTIIVD